MTENNPLLDTELSKRLNTLKSDISRESAEIKAAHNATDSDHGTGKAMGIGMRATSELVASVLVGTLIGWQIDSWFATSPIFLLIFLLLGVASGFWNVYRIAMQPTGLQKNRSQ
jgi:ATP synthase protein I